MRRLKRVGAVVAAVAMAIGCIDLTAKTSVQPTQTAAVSGTVEVVPNVADRTLSFQRGQSTFVIGFCEDPLGASPGVLQPFTTTTYDEQGAYSLLLNGVDVSLPGTSNDAGLLEARCFRITHAPTPTGPSTSLDFTVSGTTQTLPKIRLWHAGLNLTDAGDALEAQWKPTPNDLVSPEVPMNTAAANGGNSAGSGSSSGFVIGNPIVRMSTDEGPLWQLQVAKGDTSAIVQKMWLDDRPASLTVSILALVPNGVQFTSERIPLPAGPRPPSRGARCVWNDNETIPCPLTDGRHTSTEVNAPEVVFTLDTPLQASKILVRGYKGEGLTVETSQDGQHFLPVGSIGASSSWGYVARAITVPAPAMTYRLRASGSEVGTLGEVVLLP